MKLTLLCAILMAAVYNGHATTPKLPSVATLFENCISSITTTTCSVKDTYRSIEGTCNNQRRKVRGAAHTALIRLIGAEYAPRTRGGIPRGFPGTGQHIPPANQVSQGVFQAVEENCQRTRLGVSVIFMTYGQFLDHDLSLVEHPECDITSCKNEKVAFTYPCFPIRFTKNGDRCTSNARSFPQCQSQRTGGREFNNKISAYLDASNVYSNEPSLLQRLRTNDDTGRLKLTNNLLPLRTAGCTLRQCSLVGEARADENPALNSMQTLWAREHNRIADNLKKVNPHWKEEVLFQQSRKIVGAILQQISYNEFIPLLADLKTYGGYKTHVDPSISNAFAAAAFRFGHTLIPNSFARLNKNFNHAQHDLSLQNAFRNIMPVREDGIEPIMFGLLKNQSQDFDTKFAFGIARRLFVPVGSNGHRDLMALNIQRGRDHGLPTYGAYRRFCKLKSVTRFSQLHGIIRSSAIPELKKLYSSPGEIDLYAAASSEIPEEGKLLGPTFICLVKDQFERIRDGDRFFYQRSGTFTPAQLSEIRKVTFARVLCDNLKGIVSIQRDVFRALNGGEKRVECGNIRGIDFMKWKTSISGTGGGTPQSRRRHSRRRRRRHSRRRRRRHSRRRRRRHSRRRRRRHSRRRRRRHSRRRRRRHSRRRHYRGRRSG